MSKTAVAIETGEDWDFDQGLYLPAAPRPLMRRTVSILTFLIWLDARMTWWVEDKEAAARKKIEAAKLKTTLTLAE